MNLMKTMNLIRMLRPMNMTNMPTILHMTKANEHTEKHEHDEPNEHDEDIGRPWFGHRLPKPCNASPLKVGFEFHRPILFAGTGSTLVPPPRLQPSNKEHRPLYVLFITVLFLIIVSFLIVAEADFDSFFFFRENSDVRDISVGCRPIRIGQDADHTHVIIQ